MSLSTTNVSTTVGNDLPNSRKATVNMSASCNSSIWKSKQILTLVTYCNTDFSVLPLLSCTSWKNELFESTLWHVYSSQSAAINSYGTLVGGKLHLPPLCRRIYQVISLGRNWERNKVKLISTKRSTRPMRHSEKRWLGSNIALNSTMLC